jgi:tRNA threonylcarbamoyladenosine biosynthesis protein TsaB
MPRLLSLETSTDRGAFALWSGDIVDFNVTTTICHEFNCPSGQPHAETLLPAVREALMDLGWTLDSLDAIAFDAGPGMFTGLRVSAALAQGLAVALDKPLIPVSSLEVLAESTNEVVGATTILTLLDARMNQIYAGAWSKSDAGWQPVFEPCLVNPDALDQLPRLPTPYVAAGTGVEEYPPVKAWLDTPEVTDTGVRYPSALALARLGAIRFDAGLLTDAADAIPVYVRDRVALTTAERAAGESL